MAAVATPFDFDEFDATERADAPEPVFSAADMDAAREAARNEAAAHFMVLEEQKQTQLLEVVAERLNAMATEHQETITQEVEALAKAARKLAGKICVGAAATHKTEAALALLDDYLAKTVNREPARLILSTAASTKIVSDLNKKITARNARDLITVETRYDLADNDCRLEWRGGAAAYECKDILRQIDSIFNGGAHPDAADSARKGTPS